MHTPTGIDKVSRCVSCRGHPRWRRDGLGSVHRSNQRRRGGTRKLLQGLITGHPACDGIAEPHHVLLLHRNLYILGALGDAAHLGEHLSVACGLVGGDAGLLRLTVEVVQLGVECRGLLERPVLVRQGGDGLTGVQLSHGCVDNGSWRAVKAAG